MHSEINDYEAYDPTNDDEEQWDEAQGYDNYSDEDDYYEDEEEYFVPSGGLRVLRLGLILLVLILIAAVILFGVIPYVEAMTNNAPPLPPPVQA